MKKSMDGIKIVSQSSFLSYVYSLLIILEIKWEN